MLQRSRGWRKAWQPGRLLDACRPHPTTCGHTVIFTAQDAGAFGGIHFASVCGPIDIRSFQIPANDGFSHRIEHAIARAALAWRNARFRSGGLQRKDTPRIPCCALSPDFKKARTRKKSKKFYRQIRKPETVKSISIVMDLGFQRGKLHFASYESDQILNLTGSRVETQS